MNMKTMMNTRKSLYGALLALFTLMPTSSHAEETDDSHMEWSRDGRYGMFIHWGLYSIAGGEWEGKDFGKEAGGASAEWIMNSAKIPPKVYRETFTPQFNPTDFDADFLRGVTVGLKGSK